MLDVKNTIDVVYRIFRCVPEADWITGIKYTGIVRKRRKGYSPDASYIIDSHVSLDELRRQAHFTVPIWGIMHKVEDSKWCHDSTLADVRLGDTVIVNFTIKHFDALKRLQRTTEYRTIYVRRPRTDSSVSDILSLEDYKVCLLYTSRCV